MPGGSPLACLEAAPLEVAPLTCLEVVAPLAGLGPWEVALGNTSTRLTLCNAKYAQGKFFESHVNVLHMHSDCGCVRVKLLIYVVRYLQYIWMLD